MVDGQGSVERALLLSARLPIDQEDLCVDLKLVRASACYLPHLI